MKCWSNVLSSVQSGLFLKSHSALIRDEGLVFLQLGRGLFRLISWHLLSGSSCSVCGVLYKLIISALFWQHLDCNYPVVVIMDHCLKSVDFTIIPDLKLSVYFMNLLSLLFRAAKEAKKAKQATKKVSTQSTKVRGKLAVFCFTGKYDGNLTVWNSQFGQVIMLRKHRSIFLFFIYY